MNQGEALRQVRLIHGVLLATILAYVWLGERLSLREFAGVGLANFALAMAGLGALTAALGFRRKLRWAQEALSLHPDDVAALDAWRSASIVSLALCEGVGLSGFALRMLGGAPWQAAPFYGVAALLMLFWTPRLDIPGRSLP